MTVKELSKLFAYNAWANNRVFEALARIPESEYTRDLKGGYRGLQGTMTHLVAAEKIWLARLTGKPEAALMSAEEVPGIESLKRVWEDVAARMARFVSRLDDKGLEKQLEYVTTKGEKFSNEQNQILQHIVNHSSYHRGQIAVLLRQLGKEPVNTDLIAFFRHTALR